MTKLSSEGPSNFIGLGYLHTWEMAQLRNEMRHLCEVLKTSGIIPQQQASTMEW